MNQLIINISKDYSQTPGGRHKEEGPYSGEDFRQKLLRPKFVEAKETGVKLVVELDGGYGYAPSFLEEAFGGLARELHDPKLKEIDIVSNEEPALIGKIQKYIADAL